MQPHENLPATLTAATTTAARFVLRFIDLERAAAHVLTVQVLNGACCIGARHLDEREPARAAGLAIDRHDDVGRLSDGREVGSKVRFGGTVREIPDEQTNCQGFLVKDGLL